jgi:hypothetical protein
MAIAHLIRLIGSFASDRLSYSRYRRLKLERLDCIFESLPGEAWLEVLRERILVCERLSLFRERYPAPGCVVSCRPRVFRVMTQANVDLERIKTRFSVMSWKLGPNSSPEKEAT